MNFFTKSKARGEERRGERREERREPENKGRQDEILINIIRTVAVFRWVNITSYSYVFRHRPYL